jgi:hypothetical protein
MPGPTAAVELLPVRRWPSRVKRSDTLRGILFTSRNFSTSFLMMFAFGFTLYATTVRIRLFVSTA